MKLGLYTRISVDPTGTSEAPGRQEEACRLWAERNGHEIVKLYTDRDISGYKDVQRPAFSAMLTDLGSEIEGVLCWRIDRLLRNWRDWAKLDTLLDSGAVLLTEDGTDSRRDAAILAIKVAFAKEESRKISDRLKAKYATQAQAGKPPQGGHRAFGYTRQREIVQDEAQEIRKAVAHLLRGGALKPLTEDWNQRGIQTSTGGRWTTSALRGMLQRRYLVGERDHRGSTYEGKWESIISEQEHAALVRMFATRTRSKPLRHHFASGVFACALCGAALGASRGRYQCSCGKVSVSIAHAERYITEALEARSRDIRPLGEVPDHSAEIESLQERIKALDVSHFGEGVPDRFTYRAIRDGLTAKLTPLLRQQARAENLKSLPSVGFDDWWGALDMHGRAEKARAWIERITVSSPGRGQRAYQEAIFKIFWR